MAIPFRKLGRSEVVFQRRDGKGKYQMLAVERLYAYCIRTNMPEYRLPVLREHALFFRNKRNIEEARLLNLRRNPEFIKMPGLMIKDYTMPDIYQTDLVDGHHRYVMLYLMKRLLMGVYVVEPTVWKQYLVKHYPANMEEHGFAPGSGIHYD